MRAAAAAARNRLGLRDGLAVGATLFSMFFGAGNLILPPLLGVQAGPAVVPATAGFFIAGVGLPVLGIVAVALAGTVRELAERVHPVFSRVFVAAVYLAIGPCLAIPRTSSTAFEMLQPLLPGGSSVEVARLLFSVAFFAAAFALALHPGRLTRLLGRVTGPALIALIIAVVAPSLLALAAGTAPDPAPAPVVPYDGNAAVQGFLTGYQTMDLLASLTFGLVIANNIKNLGVTEPGGIMREVCRAGVIAGVLMMAIYGGLAAVGFSLSGTLAGVANGAAVIASSAALSYGPLGSAVVAAIFLLACLNVCTGLISCCGSYFAGELPRVPYRAWALGFAVFSCAVSNVGLDAILAFSVPLLNALYPMAIVLVAGGILHRALDAVPLSWPAMVGFVGVASIAESLRTVLAPGMRLPSDALPLAGMGLGWISLAVVGAAVGALLSLLLPRLRKR